MELLRSFCAEISGDEVKCQLFLQTKLTTSEALFDSLSLRSGIKIAINTLPKSKILTCLN